jgi:hypothetical protein
MGISDTIIANVLSGLIVAVIAALVGIGIAKWFTARPEQIRARRERNLAASAELYRIYGEFFTVWKVWNAHLRNQKPAPPEALYQESAFLTIAAGRN